MIHQKIIKRVALDVYAACIGILLLIVTIFWMGELTPDLLVVIQQFFGDFDPFGDFELLFPAAVLGLGLADVPVRYMARTYGSTNISRFRHGLQLLRMTLIGLFRIRLGSGV